MRTPLSARVGGAARFVVPGIAVAALGAGIAFSVPEQGVTTAVPAPAAATTSSTTSAPLAARSTDQAIGRSETRPSLTPPPSSSPTASAKPSTAPKKQPAKAAAAPKPQPSRTGAAATRYAEVTLNLRSAPSDDARTGTDLAAGSKISITGWTLGEWAQVLTSRDAVRWVKKEYLTSSQPAVKKKSAVASNSSVTGGACASGSAVERGLTPDAIKVHRAICHAFPSITSYGGVRADSLPEHPSGRALDAMVSGSPGWQVAQWVRAHAKELGVSEVIHAQKIWTVQRSGEGWRSMSDRGSATANHYDHVHVTVYGNAAS